MNLELSDEQVELRATVRRWATTEAPVADQARPVLDGAAWRPDGPWRSLVAMGVTDALGVVDAAVVAEELGRVLYPGPWRPSIAAAWLADAAGAHVTGPAAVDLVDGWTLDGDRVSGESVRVPGVPQAEVVLLAAGDVVVAVDHPAVEVDESIDPTSPTASVRLDRSPCRVLGEVDAATRSQIADRAAVLDAADALGTARAVLDAAVDHAKVRHQFGQPIGAFQAVAHLCVDLLETVELFRGGVLHAAWAADAATPDERRLAVVRLHAFADRLVTVADGAIQVLGGIGCTWEHDAHLHLRRLLAWSAAVGPASAHRVALGRALLGAS